MDKPREMYEKLQLINQNLEDIKRLKFPFSTLGNKEKVTKKGGLKARRVSVHCTTEAVCERRYERRYTNIPAVFACDGADDGSGSSSSGSCDNGGATIYQGKQRLMTSKSVLYPSKTLGKFEDSLESIVSYDRVAGIGLDDNGLHSEDNKQTFYEKNVTVGFDNLAHQTGTKLNSSKSYSFTLEAQDSLFVPKDVPKHGPFSHKRSHLSSLHNTRSIINHSSFPHQRSVSTAEEQFHLNTSQKLEYPSVSREFTLSARTLSSSTPQKIDSMLVESLDTLKALELEVESNFSTLNNRADTAISAFRRNSLCKIDESNRVMFLNPKSPKLGPQLSYLPLDAELSMGSRFRDQRLVSNRGLNNKQSSKNCHSNDTPRVSPRVKQRPSSVFFSSTISEPEYTFSIDNNLLST
ncbi:hypothetical protein AX774_g5481 [Zancudomyces culisetae]|uniref:Uncharacterized protein n=1 Tax=Zancudomyces culisetae TaxID=1213189 RepID=A0A1R1PJE3_ZANCU|nr:hypothetical protein AX774_g5481 [Zancudomyces culisetae]|eukprot:OMH81067.1 hypothetical protein AX774_g5481 [Zancudomyces culisetae]